MLIITTVCQISAPNFLASTCLTFQCGRPGKLSVKSFSYPTSTAGCLEFHSCSCGSKTNTL